MSSGDESTDMMISHPDIEEIDNKLTAKRRRKELSPPKNKKPRIPDDVMRNEIKIVLKKEELSPKFKGDTKKEDAISQDLLKTEVKKEEPTYAAPQDLLKTKVNVKKEEATMKTKQDKEFKELQKALVQVEKEMLRKQKEEQKRLMEEEKKAKKEEREQKKQLTEEEKKMKQLEREERIEERLREKEQKEIEKEERRKKREEEQAKRTEKKRQLEEEAVVKRREQALKGMKYLLSVSEKYSDFYKEKLTAETKPVKQSSGKPLQERNKLLPTVDDMKEAANLQTDKTDINQKTDITQELKYFENGKLHPYQIEGVTWLKLLFDNGINGILADEMGLGKTVQVIALICHLLEKEISGPFLIIVPLSTLPNWKSEFQRFAPQVPTVVFHGNEVERSNLYRKITKKYKVGNVTTLPVILTSYQIPPMEQRFLKRLTFQYVVVDEGHRIKNHETKLAVTLRSFNSSNRLLLTGTPLQNNITELWALLNFLMPHLFTNMDTFASLLMLDDMQDENKLIEQEEKNNVLNTLHRVLSPFMLRRLKKDVLKDLVPKKEVIVYCPMSKLQKMLYTSVIEKNLNHLLLKENEDDEPELLDIDKPRPVRRCRLGKSPAYHLGDPDEDDFSDYEEAVLESCSVTPEEIEKPFKPFMIRLTMQNTVIMFRKIVDHPYLIHFPLDPNAEQKCLLVNEDLITNSGKMMVLDVLLERLKQTGHKVLIFSTLVITLDLIEEMLILRNHQYRRIDGSRNLEERGDSIDDFNKDPEILAFLLSTRAGGLGLNLTGADTCIFFDRDWNPQADIQAEARCHRIGQTRPVMVYTLVAKNTIDEKIITCGYQKRLLEKLVIKDGKFTSLKEDDRFKSENYLKELKELLNNDANKPFEEEFSNEELDKLLDRSELYELMEKMDIKE